MFKSNPVPKISSTTRTIDEQFNKRHKEISKDKSLDQQAIDNTIVEVNESYSELIVKEFGHKYDEKFIQEFQAYLMTESEQYMKWIASKIK